MLTGTPPFNGESESIVYAKILAGELPIFSLQTAPISIAAEDLMRKLLTLEPDRRLGSAG